MASDAGIGKGLVFKKYSHTKLQVKREALQKLELQADEMN